MTIYQIQILRNETQFEDEEKQLKKKKTRERNHKEQLL